MGESEEPNRTAIRLLRTSVARSVLFRKLPAHRTGREIDIVGIHVVQLGMLPDRLDQRGIRAHTAVDCEAGDQ